MALSANAIGFYLEAEDVSLSKTLKSATSNYESYTKALEEYNERAFKSTQRGMGQVSDLLKSVKDLPAAVEKSMKSASGKISKQLKPITQKVDLQVTVKSATKLKKLFSQAVSEAMSGANIRLSSSLPQKRMAMFQQGVGLRAQYQDVVQPPDMKGKLSPLKKYNKGGVVEGPAGIDKVLALLTKDEMVLPADVSKELQEAAGGRLKSAGGKFASAKELGTMVAEVTNLAEALEKMKGGLEAGIGGKDEQEQYAKGVEHLTKQVEGLTEAQDDLSFVTKVRLGPSILQVTERLEELREEGDDTGSRIETLLGKIMGPARFLAIAKGIETVQEGFSSLRSGAGAAFSTLGGDEIGSGIDSINQMNQFLGVSRDELLEIKVRAGQVANEIDGLTFDELGFALKEAAALGIRDTDIMFDLATTSGLAAKGLNVAAESATKLGFELTQSLNLSQEGFDATIATMGQLSDKTSGFNIDASKLFEQTTSDVETLNSSLRTMSEVESQRLIGSFNQIGAVLESQFIGAGGIRETLAKAFEGGPENVDAINRAMQLTGLQGDALKKKLESGDLSGLFEEIGDRVQGMDTATLKALSSQLGISSGELAKFGDVQDDINEGFAMSQTRIVETGDGLSVLTERASNNRSAFEKMQEAFTDTISGMDFMGIQGAEVLDMFKEFNLTSLASIAILGKPMLSALGKVGGKLAGVGGFASKAGGAMMSMGGISMKLLPMLGKLALTAGPILLVGAAVAGLTALAIDSIEETNAINKETAEKGAKLGLTEFGAVGFDIQKKKKSIAQVQKNIDLDVAAGRGPNESAVRLLERYNGQLEVLQSKSDAMQAEGDARKAAKGGGAVPDIDALMSDFAAPLTPDQIASFTGGDMNMATGATEEKLDRNNELLEQLVGIMRQQGGQAAPAVQGRATGGSGLGQSIAGGDL
jgi:hypothetical protein